MLCEQETANSKVCSQLSARTTLVSR